MLAIAHATAAPLQQVNSTPLGFRMAYKQHAQIELRLNEVRVQFKSALVSCKCFLRLIQGKFDCCPVIP